MLALASELFSEEARISPNFRCRPLRLDDLEVTFETRRVRSLRSVLGRLSPKELDVLRYLAIRANRTVSHRELLQAVWGLDYGSTDHCLRSCIQRLRKKIEAAPNQPKYLLTESWVRISP